jgi:hypothetical protein
MMMKRVLTLCASVLACSAACAEGYAGAVAALSRVDFGCTPGYSCDYKGHGGKLYAGTQLSANNSLDLGVGKLDAVEFAYLKFGGARASLPAPDAFNPALHESALTDAVAVAAVAHFPVVDQFAIVAKLGVAYVSSTLRKAQDATSLGESTENHVQPYGAIGLEYAIPNVVKIVGSLDMTRYKVGSRKGNARMIGIGAETNF